MPLFVSLADHPVLADDVTNYALADAQFDKYQPPTHRYLAIGPKAFAGAVAWAPLTERLVVREGDRSRRAALLPTFTRPMPGREADLDDWYTTAHVPEVLTVPGFAAGQRFARLDPATDAATRLALYELDAADLDGALAALQTALPAMHQTDALDRTSIASWCFVPLEI